MLEKIIIVGLGGFLGSSLRYLVQLLMQDRYSTSFPLGTITVNLVGCFVIGVIFGMIEKGNILNPNIRLLLAVGFCGGFTTFSSFAYESLQLAKSGSIIYLATYIGVSVFLGVILTYFGMQLIKQF